MMSQTTEIRHSVSGCGGKTRQALCITIVLSLISSCAVWAATGGKTTANFLSIMPDPIDTAMGGSSVASISASPSHTPVNPAGLLGVSRPFASFDYLSYLSDIRYHFASFAFPATYGTLGGSLGYLTYGSIEGYDNSFNRIDVQSSYDAFGAFSYAFPITASVPVYREFGSLGVNLKFIQSQLALYSAEAIALDVGGIVKVPYVDGLTLGAAYRNLGSGMKFVLNTNSLPTGLLTGIAYNNRAIMNLLLVADYDIPAEGPAAVSMGISVSPVYYLSLRTGYRYSENALMPDYRAGIGLDFGDFSLNYALEPFADFNPVHQISVTMALGGISNIATASDYYLRKHFEEACSRYYQKDYIEARQQFEEILTIYPDHRESKKYLEKIVEALNTMEGTSEKNSMRYLKKADVALERKDALAARRYYNYVLGVDPDNENARSGLQQADQMIEDGKKEKIRQQNVDRINRIWKKAVKDYVAGNFVRSKERFNEILAIDVDNQEAKKYIVEIDNQLTRIAASQVDELYVKASDLYRKGNFEEAIRYFEAVSIAAPQRLDAQDYVKKCKENIADREARLRADKLAKEQQRMDKEMESTYKRALSYYEKGSKEAALDYFLKAEKIAVAYEFAEYIDSVKNYISLLKTSLSAEYYKRGFENFRSNNFEAAAADYRKALEYNVENTSAKVEYERLGKDISQYYYEQGMKYFSLNEMDKSKEAFQKSLYFNPNKIESQRALERIK